VSGPSKCGSSGGRSKRVGLQGGRKRN
jgi:hypothetical protein